MKSSKLFTTLIVVATIGLVAAPLVGKGLRVEIAHWYLAAGANAVELGSGSATSAIENAERWYPKLTELQDYWLLRIKQSKSMSSQAMLELVRDAPEKERADLAIQVANELISMQEFGKAADAYKIAFGREVLNNEEYWRLLVMDAYQTSPPAAVQVLREAMLHNSRFGALALQYSLALASRLEFNSALEALHLALDEKSQEPAVLNQLAYFRALARAELDQALEDINLALKANEDEPALRDTRGWVLYHLDRPKEALEDANFAIEATERFSISGTLERMLGELTTAPDYAVLLPDGLADSKTSSRSLVERKANKSTVQAPEYLTMSTANPFLWNLGVLRYHRAKILDKLHRTEDAQRDWEWIKTNNFPPDDRLH